MQRLQKRAFAAFIGTGDQCQPVVKTNRDIAMDAVITDSQPMNAHDNSPKSDIGMDHVEEFA